MSRLLDVVAALIVRGDSLLVCQRHHDGAFPLKWEFPGGKVELGELPEAALVRELKEELDIEVEEMKYFHDHSHLYPNGTEVRLKFYVVGRINGQLKNRVFEQVRWAGRQELANLDFLDGDLPLVQKLIDGEMNPFVVVKG